MLYALHSLFAAHLHDVDLKSYGGGAFGDRFCCWSGSRSQMGIGL